MWRSSQRTRCPVCEHWVFSTYVEVILLAFPDDWKFYGILHVCGGHPITISIYNLAVLYSPRMWRSSYDKKVSDIMMGVFSTYVEVIPNFTVDDNSGVGILHVCGGHPKRTGVLVGGHQYSPRMWRSSHSLQNCFQVNLVFSTYVEVILCWLATTIDFSGILHVCGGHPMLTCNHNRLFRYSPRMWRSSFLLLNLELFVLVFSTYVEVILVAVFWPVSGSGILHVCGGHPATESKLLGFTQYSPRMWRSSPCQRGWGLHE